MFGNGEKAHCGQWVEQQSTLIDDGDSDSSSSPLVAKRPAILGTPRRLTGSPRRNGIVLDANVRSLFGLRATRSPHRRSQSPDKTPAASPPEKMYSCSIQHQQAVISSLSDLSLQSASSQASWQSPSSTTSTKRGLDLPLDGSPEPKKRLTSGTTSSFRYSAPCLQPDFETTDRGERRGGLLRRSAAPIQSLLSAPRSSRLVPSVSDRRGSTTENFWDKIVNFSADRFSEHPWPGHAVDHPSTPRDEATVRKRRSHPFWRLTSPPIIESRQAEEAAEAEALLSGLGGDQAERLGASQGLALEHELQLGTTPPHDVDDEMGARLNALRALEGIREEMGNGEATSDGVNVYTFDETNPIVMCGQRRYSDWTGYLNGAPRRISGAGALFPEGYVPLIGDAEPWVCPVRDCQTVFPEVWALGGHFSALHRGTLLNDNRDGTMSVVGRRRVPDPISGRMPPIVVSRKPIDPTTATPKAAIRRPGRRKKAEVMEKGRPGKPRGENKATEAEQPPPTSDSSNTCCLSSSLPSVQIPTSDEEHAKGEQRPTLVSLTKTSPAEEILRTSSVWRYLMTWLPHDTQLPPNKPLLELLNLDLQRRLPHQRRPQLAGRHPSVRMLCAVLVYLTGTPTEPPCGTCASLTGHLGAGDAAADSIPPFPQCVRLPEGVSADLKEYFGEGVCCNGFDQDPDSRNQTPPVSRSDSKADDAPPSTPRRSQSPTVHGEAKEADSSNDNDKDSDSHASVALSPATARGSPAYKTAVPVQIAGPPRMVSIRGASGGGGSGGARASTKTKRHSSIRRLAAKLGGKAARREIAVYKPREKTLSECAEQPEAQVEGSVAGAPATSERTTTHGTRRSRRLRELQLRTQSEVPSKASSSGVGVSPSKASKLKSKGTTGRGEPQSLISETRAALAGLPGAQGDTGAAPSMPLTLADWEIAPGRIREGTGLAADNVAFSSSYLAQGRAVPVADGATFQYVELSPGDSLRWAADPSRIRVCSVARGVVLVKLSESEFRISSNGMWKVTPGVACAVSNPFMVGAMIHVTAIGEDGF